MILPSSLFASNPFFDAYIQSDFMGKMIFLGLLALSIWSWIILLYKFWLTTQAKRFATQFLEIYHPQKRNPLGLEIPAQQFQKGVTNPFLEVYLVLKKQTLEILNKNRHFGIREKAKDTASSFLSPADVDYLESHVMTAIAHQTKHLEKNLFVLSTIVTLAPFLGLLGTVWGILTTFSDLQAHAGGGGAHQMVLGGLSLALASTVLGLLDAIPALIGYNYLKHSIKDFQTEMEGFSNEVLAAVEMQYRQVDVR